MLLFLHSISSLDDCIVTQCTHLVLHFMSLTFDLLHTELNLKIPLRTEISQIYIVKLPELCLGTPSRQTQISIRSPLEKNSGSALVLTKTNGLVIYNAVKSIFGANSKEMQLTEIGCNNPILIETFPINSRCHDIST